LAIPLRISEILHTQTNNYTRVWLEDFATKHPDPSSLDLHGFDISPAQFPTAHEIILAGKTRIPLSVHDTLLPYPPEHLGRYDLVHIRLLTAGLKQGDYTVLLKNARSLLSMYYTHHQQKFILSQPHLRRNPTN
jgi:hypothetical protein